MVRILLFTKENGLKNICHGTFGAVEKWARV